MHGQVARSSIHDGEGIALPKADTCKHRIATIAKQIEDADPLFVKKSCSLVEDDFVPQMKFIASTIQVRAEPKTKNCKA
jgi:hypothetical protein